MIPKYEAIAADIRRILKDGSLKPGDKLPTVESFASCIAFPKSPSNERSSRITEEGLITSRRGNSVPTSRTRRGFRPGVFPRQERPCPRLF